MMPEEGIERYRVIIEGSYQNGSFRRGGTYSAAVFASSTAEAIIEVFDGLGKYGHISRESGDCDWSVFEDEYGLTIHVEPHVNEVPQ